jgi:hypothetical protein
MPPSSAPRATSSVVRPSDLVSLFAPVIAASGAEWMIAGGVAAIIYGEPRLTQDIDVVAALREEDAARFAAQFPSSDFYCPPVETIVEEARREAFGHFNLLHLESDARADVYLAGRDPLARRGLDARRTVELVGQLVPIAPPEYVILHKLRFRQQGASERHLRDIRAMLRVLGDSIDLTALELEANAFGLSQPWREMQVMRD